MDIIPQDSSPRKQCTGICGRFLPNTTEFFHRNGKDKLYPQCKECRSKKGKAYYRKPGVAERRHVYSKNYRAENHEYVRAHKKEYYSKPEIQEHRRNYMRDFRTGPGVVERKHVLAKVYLKNPKTWAKHRAYGRVYDHNRRARMMSIPGTHTLSQIQDLLKRQKHKCYYCFNKFKQRGDRYLYHIDHVVPISRGGSNDISNIVLACPPCNQHKNARMPHEWPEGGRLL